MKETHSPTVELLRHFLLRFFDSDLISNRAEMTPVILGALPVFFQWFFLLIGPLRHKYAHFNHLPIPGPYREAVRADELWLITLMMSIVGLLTAIKWQTLFPDLRDYRVLGTLPLRPIQIFGAKLTALILVAVAALITVNFLPTLGFPALSSSHWALQPSLAARTFAHACASFAACAFFFFSIVAPQGVLLNLLRPRAFGRVTGYLQGCVVGLMLGLIVVSFSIQSQISNTLIDPQWARFLPPVWFLGLYQTLSGDPDPAMRALSNRAVIALATAVALTLLTYLVSYRRHRTLLIEGASPRRKNSHWDAALSRRPRRQAILAFMTKTLGRSNYHRTILLGYAGLAFALLLTGVAGMRAADFVYYHILALVFLLIGVRHLFSRPVELKANWIFQIMEGESRVEWMQAVDRFVLFCGAPLLLLPLPIELHLLGLRGVAETTLFLALGLLAYEWAFFEWSKLPFTCAHLPGKTPIWLVLGSLGLLAALGLLHSLLLAALYNEFLYIALLTVLSAAWLRVRRSRRERWEEVRLKYEENPEPAIHALNLLH